ncbi:MAG: hypothetical protein KGL39_19365 [Patescibacteria group bacterium]|nr:hypothetical protein [Patescibacteria group bacterium]
MSNQINPNSNILPVAIAYAEVFAHHAVRIRREPQYTEMDTTRVKEAGEQLIAALQQLLEVQPENASVYKNALKELLLACASDGHFPHDEPNGCLLCEETRLAQELLGDDGQAD